MKQPFRLFCVAATAAALPLVLGFLGLPPVLGPETLRLAHTAFELLGGFVALAIFGLGWFTFPVSRDRLSLFVGAGFLGAGLLAIVHALVPGAPSTSIGLVGRGALALVLVAASLGDLRPRGIRRPAALACALGGTVVLGLVGLAWGPAPVWDGAGWVVVGLVATAVAIDAVQVYRGRAPLGPTFLTALVVLGVAEVQWAVLGAADEATTVWGPAYRAWAFVLVYRAVFVATVRRPFERLSQSAAEKEVLVRELHHRTKNTLQMVQGLIVLQASEGADVPEVKELVRKTEERIQAISLVHQRLFCSPDLSRVDLKDYIQDLGHLVVAGHRALPGRPKLDVAVEAGAVLLDLAVPLGLILNELLSNSLSHGFPGDEEGTITVRLGAGRPGRLVLQYDDDGIGLPPGFDLERPESLGLTLVKTIGTQQLKGRVELSGRGGFHCTIDFPTEVYRPRL